MDGGRATPALETVPVMHCDGTGAEEEIGDWIGVDD